MPHSSPIWLYRLRLHGAVPRTDRLALEDDVIPLSKPVHTAGGRTLTSILIKAGQVRHISPPRVFFALTIYFVTGHPRPVLYDAPS